ncbi:hypothetical protein ABZT04_05640 [Streptomyces sp. NPDC005492]|uniref:hypothetical protein n=1 Tax=Streptomyces sp. NPDC005492 TaxID=3156883 RepID=UPI00339F4341
MLVRRRPLRAAVAGSITVIAALGLLTACGSTTHSAKAVPAGSVKTAAPSPLCTALTPAAAERLIADARATIQAAPDKGRAPDVCGYAAADGTATLSLSPASRAYDTELSAAHDLRAHPSSAGMRDVGVDPVDDLGRHAFRETAYQIQARQHLTFVVWTTGARTWVLTLGTATSTASHDKVVQVARSITAKLPTGSTAH